MSLNVQEVFNILSVDPKFVAKLELSVKNIMKDGKIDQYDIPEFVFIITDTYNEMSKFRLTYDELPQLIKMIYTFMVQKLNLIPEDKRPEFECLVNSALRLVMMQPIIRQTTNNCFSKLFPSCFKIENAKKVEVVTEPVKKEEVVTEPVKKVDVTEVVIEPVKKEEVVTEPVKKVEVVTEIVTDVVTEIVTDVVNNK